MEILGSYYSTAQVLSFVLMGGGWLWLLAIVARTSLLRALGGALFLPGLLIFGMLNFTACRWALVCWLAGFGLSYATAPPELGAGLAAVLAALG